MKKVHWKKSELWLIASPVLLLAVTILVLRGQSALKGYRADLERESARAQAPIDRERARRLEIPRATIRQKGMVFSLVFSPDGKTLASGEMITSTAWLRRSKSTTDLPISATPPMVHLWDATTGALLRQIPGVFNGGNPEITEPYFFTDDSRSLVVKHFGPQSWKLWNVASAAFLKPLSQADIQVARLRGKLSTKDGIDDLLLSALLERIRKSIPAKALNDGMDEALSSKDRYYALAYLEEGQVRGDHHRIIGLWKVATGERLWSIPVKFVDTLAFLPGEKGLVAASHFRYWYTEWGPRPVERPSSQHGEVILYDVATGRIKWNKILEDAIGRVVVSPNGSLVACSAMFKHKTYLLKSQTGEVIKTLEVKKFELGYQNGIEATFSPDGKTLATNNDQEAYLWDISGLKLN